MNHSGEPTVQPGDPAGSPPNQTSDHTAEHAHAASAAQPAGGVSPRPPSAASSLMTPEQARVYEARWNQVKTAFVDEPRQAMHEADALVGDVLDELQQLFRHQRTELEHGLDEQASTEDLRVALGHYRGMIDRLITL